MYRKWPKQVELPNQTKTERITNYCSYARPAQSGPIRTRLCGPCIAAKAGYHYHYKYYYNIFLIKGCGFFKYLIKTSDFFLSLCMFLKNRNHFSEKFCKLAATPWSHTATIYPLECLICKPLFYAFNVKFYAWQFVGATNLGRLNKILY